MGDWQPRVSIGRCSERRLRCPSRWCWIKLVELERGVARYPCSERKFQSHPAVPPGRLIGYVVASCCSPTALPVEGPVAAGRPPLHAGAQVRHLCPGRLSLMISGAAARPFSTHARGRATAPAAAESDTILLQKKVPERDLVVFHDEIKAARPAEILVRVDLVIVVAPAFIHPSIDVGERYRAIVRLVNLEFPLGKLGADDCG